MEIVSPELCFERWLIGSLMFGFPVDEIFRLVKVEDFESGELANIYSAMQKLTCENKLITIDYLLNEKIDLQCMLSIRAGVSAVSNGVYYAEQVSRNAKLRRLKQLCREALNQLTQGNVEDINEISMTLSNNIDQNLQYSNVITPNFTKNYGQWSVDRIQQEESPQVIHTGLSGLDDSLRALNGGRLVLVGARTGIGKTALAIQTMLKSAHRGRRVAYFSLEIEASSLFEIISSNEFGINRTKLARKDNSDLSPEKVESFCQKMDKKLFIYDNKRTFVDICSEIRILKRRNNIDFAIIDYIGLVNGQQKSFETTVDYYTRMSKELKALSLQLQIPIIVLVQLNRECVRANRKPMLSDIKDSGSFEQDADMVIMLHRPERDIDEMAGVYEFDTEILILKTRIGSISGKGEYIFNGRTQQFRDKAPSLNVLNYTHRSKGF